MERVSADTAEEATLKALFVFKYNKVEEPNFNTNITDVFA